MNECTFNKFNFSFQNFIFHIWSKLRKMTPRNYSYFSLFSNLKKNFKNHVNHYNYMFSCYNFNYIIFYPFHLHILVLQDVLKIKFQIIFSHRNFNFWLKYHISKFYIVISIIFIVHNTLNRIFLSTSIFEKSTNITK